MFFWKEEEEPSTPLPAWRRREGKGGGLLVAVGFSLLVPHGTVQCACVFLHITPPFLLATVDWVEGVGSATLFSSVGTGRRERTCGAGQIAVA